MELEIAFRRQAEADLWALYAHAAEEVSLEIAGDYLARIETACLSLRTSTDHGTRRDDIAAGLRTMVFGSRLIAYRVLEARIEIVAIAYAGGDFDDDLRQAAARDDSRGD